MFIVQWITTSLVPDCEVVGLKLSHPLFSSTVFFPKCNDSYLQCISTKFNGSKTVTILEILTYVRGSQSYFQCLEHWTTRFIAHIIEEVSSLNNWEVSSYEELTVSCVLCPVSCAGWRVHWLDWVHLGWPSLPQPQRLPGLVSYIVYTLWH